MKEAMLKKILIFHDYFIYNICNSLILILFKCSSWTGFIININVVVLKVRPCLNVYTMSGLDADVSVSLQRSVLRASNFLAGILI